MGIIRYRVVFKYLGGMLLVLGGAFLLTASVSLFLRERLFFYYLFLSVSSALFGWRLFRWGPEKELTAPEAAAIASLSFLITSLAGALPFLFINKMAPIDAWFESMSGFTTTGFSLMDLKTTPDSLLFFRALTQWLGGVGFVVITVSLLLVSGNAAIVLFKEGPEKKLFPRITRHVQVIVVTYVTLTMIGAMALLLSGLKAFDAVCYALSGVSTGGFAVHQGSISDIPYKWAPLAVTLVMTFGSINFILYYLTWKTHRNFWKALRAFFKSPQVISLFISIALIGFFLYMTIGNAGLLDTLFLAASAQTTTGYYILDPSNIPAIAIVALTASMFIGGSMGSTSGGIKLFRLIELLKNLKRFLLRRLYPREVVLPEDAFDKGFAREELVGLLYIIIIYLFFIFTGASIFIWYGFDPLRAVFEVTSAVGTVGLSSGIVSPELGTGLKLVLIFLMWAGRLEFLPVLLWAYSFSVRSH